MLKGLKILNTLKILNPRDRLFKILRILRIFKILNGPCFSPKYLIFRNGMTSSKGLSKFEKPFKKMKGLLKI